MSIAKSDTKRSQLGVERPGRYDPLRYLRQLRLDAGLQESFNDMAARWRESTDVNGRQRWTIDDCNPSEPSCMHGLARAECAPCSEDCEHGITRGNCMACFRLVSDGEPGFTAPPSTPASSYKIPPLTRCESELKRMQRWKQDRRDNLRRWIRDQFEIRLDEDVSPEMRERQEAVVLFEYEAQEVRINRDRRYGELVEAYPDRSFESNRNEAADSFPFPTLPAAEVTACPASRPPTSNSTTLLEPAAMTEEVTACPASEPPTSSSTAAPRPAAIEEYVRVHLPQPAPAKFIQVKNRSVGPASKDSYIRWGDELSYPDRRRNKDRAARVASPYGGARPGPKEAKRRAIQHIRRGLGGKMHGNSVTFASTLAPHPMNLPSKSEVEEGQHFREARTSFRATHSAPQNLVTTEDAPFPWVTTPDETMQKKFFLIRNYMNDTEQLFDELLGPEPSHRVFSDTNLDRVKTLCGMIQYRGELQHA